MKDDRVDVGGEEVEHVPVAWGGEEKYYQLYLCQFEHLLKAVLGGNICSFLG